MMVASADAPEFCPLCGNSLDPSDSEYDNSGNGSYTSWYYIECKKCGARGTVSVNRNE